MYLITVLADAEPPRQNSFTINNEQVAINENLLMQRGSEVYISIRELSSILDGYIFQTGEFGRYVGRIDKAYVETDSEIVGFAAGSNRIFKTGPNTNIDNAYFELESEIIMENNNLYINLNDVRICFWTSA